MKSLYTCSPAMQRVFKEDIDIAVCNLKAEDQTLDKAEVPAEQTTGPTSALSSSSDSHGTAVIPDDK